MLSKSVITAVLVARAFQIPLGSKTRERGCLALYPRPKIPAVVSCPLDDDMVQGSPLSRISKVGVQYVRDRFSRIAGRFSRRADVTCCKNVGAFNFPELEVFYYNALNFDSTSLLATPRK